jgi:acetolactate synthase-1/2/3 large subunit
VLYRGIYDKPTEVAVTEHVPSFLHDLDQKEKQRLDRLDLAQWILSAENPLVARVAANRAWQTFFGKGIVATAEAPVAPPVTWRDWRKRNARRLKVAGLGFLALLAALALASLAPQRGLTQAEVEVAVQKILDAPGSVLVSDGGEFGQWAQACLQAPRRVINGPAGSIGSALPFAAAAKLAFPHAPVVAVMGDGSFGFTAGELETIVRLRVPLMMVVISNSSYGWIKAGQKTGFGQRYFSVDFSRTDHARVAEAFGVKAWRVQKPKHHTPACAAAAEHGAPALVDVIAQPLQDARAPVSEWVA